MKKTPQNSGRTSTAIRRQSGMTLLEIMIALGVGGVLTYFLTTMLTNTSKQVTSISNKNDFTQFANELQGIFNNAERCKLVFKATNTVVPALDTLGAPGDPGTHPVTISLNTGNTDPTKGPLGQAYTTGMKWGNTLTIKTFEFAGKKNLGGTSQFTIPFHVAVSRRVGDGKTGSETAAGGDVLQKTFNLTVSLDREGKKIVGCAGQYIDYWMSTGPTKLDIIYRDGGVGVGTPATPTAKLAVLGSTQARAYQYHSDARLKRNIREIPGALERVSKLHGVLFDWRDRSTTSTPSDQLGFLAQEVETVFPEAVVTDPGTGLKSVAYSNLLAPMIEALKERQKILVEQDRQIAELKKALASP